MKKQIKTLDELKDSKLLYDKDVPSFGYMIVIIISTMLGILLTWSCFAKKTDIIAASGIIKSENKNYVMSPFTGEITEINIQEGQNVEEGDILLKLRSSDLNIQYIQLSKQKEIYEFQIQQYEKLSKSIQDGENYFEPDSKEDVMYYNQYEAYISQVKQNEIDTSTYKGYGYTEVQIEAELVKNQAKIAEIYHNAMQVAEKAIWEARMQVETIEAQIEAINLGKDEYEIKANTTGIIHMIAGYEKGMVVQTTTTIASIASEQDVYVVEAYLGAADRARISEGDVVDVGRQIMAGENSK